MRQVGTDRHRPDAVDIPSRATARADRGKPVTCRRELRRARLPFFRETRLAAPSRHRQTKAEIRSRLANSCRVDLPQVPLVCFSPPLHRPHPGLPAVVFQRTHVAVWLRRRLSRSCSRSAQRRRNTYKSASNKSVDSIRYRLGQPRCTGTLRLVRCSEKRPAIAIQNRLCRTLRQRGVRIRPVASYRSRRPSLLGDSTPTGRLFPPRRLNRRSQGLRAQAQEQTHMPTIDVSSYRTFLREV